jgi:hypothetical protein
MAGEIFANLDLEMLAMLRAAMAEDPELGQRAEQIARALYFGGNALAMRCETTAQMETELDAFAQAHLAGARVLARTAA